MSEFRLTIKTDNAVFDDDSNAELARILREVARKLDDGVGCGNLRDGNGNVVGDFGSRIDGVMP